MSNKPSAAFLMVALAFVEASSSQSEKI